MTTEMYGPFGTDPIEQTLRQGPQKDPVGIIARIEREKRDGTRPLPSSSLRSIGEVPSKEERVFLVDTCARLVDENWAGRSEMCIQFAALIRHGLGLFGYPATVELGKATYTVGGQSFEWDHAWVITQAGDIVDGNVDSMTENPMVPEGIEPEPYWGPASALPADREFHKLRELPPERDEIELEPEEIMQWKGALEREVERSDGLGKV